ncbi:sulfotransferase family 2 domain-containing protein [Salibacter halophilus]|uniref:Sulfotransferase family protein n=1 Tax=Salibacter halophilus TaxID=1803916 RepID=A0A6N6MA68_9FLAO|nr:sulfotransferase family 2 domain-containing protein [Salibacter halophilus]KAB1063975.1 sulfotransferase family protein [Salibacter halophilus]
MKIKNNIEIVSLHIPKTAGTSFRTILKDKIGDSRVVRLDIHNKNDIRLNEKAFTKDKLRNKIKVVHGHFKFADIKELFDLDPSVKYVTWLRDPVDRVLSHYYYLMKMAAIKMGEQAKDEILSKVGKSLEEYVVHDQNRNEISHFLEGSSFDDFDFIGIQKDFENELNRFRKVMGWSNIENQRHNVTGSKKPAIDKKTVELIKSYNEKDVEIYEEALKRHQKIVNS